MLLAPLLRNVLMYGGLAIAGITILVLLELRKMRRRQPARAALPDAKLVSERRPFRRTFLRWLPALAIASGIGLFYWSYLHRFEYVIVRDGDHGPTAIRRVSADRVSDVAFAPGVSAPDNDFGLDPVWVVNLSSRTVRVETVQYGRGLSFGNDPELIPPHTSAHFTHIDHIGPGDRPPSMVRDDVNLGMAFRDWLTWDE